ncbi:MAG: dTMP kinase [Acidimicrobiia bacterium]
MTGRFLVIEGGDGSGKSTQRDLLVAWLRESGIDAAATLEPGGSELGVSLRKLLLDGGAIAPRAEALLMAADRAQHVADVIGPALARGAWVVSDRHVPSSLVYQGVVRDLGVDEVGALSKFAADGLIPDLVVVLDVDDATAEQRRSPGSDRMEREGGDFHRQVRRAYRTLAEANGWTVIDGTGAPEAVAARVRAVVEPLVNVDSRPS